jgi:hypothetical protein
MRKNAAKKASATKAKRPKRTPEPDVNQLAHHLINMATAADNLAPFAKAGDEAEAAGRRAYEEAVAKPAVPVEISRFMAEMGRRGGKIGGAARAASLTKKRRREIAVLAAQKRWENRPKSDNIV